MKRFFCISFIFAAFFCPLFLSCSDDTSGNRINPIYDLRLLTRVSQEFDSTIQRPNLLMNRKKRLGHWLVPSGEGMMPGIHDASLRESAAIEKTYTFTYGNNAHLYWTEAIGKDTQGITVATAKQTLDDAGFPTRVLWYDGEGNFMYAYDYTYDTTLYLRTSVISYLDDPTDNPDVGKDYEFENVWNEDGILTTQSYVEYDSNGVKEYEGKWRSTTIMNSLRGSGGMGYDEYYREYEEGLLTYQEETTFDQAGYPEILRIDNHGDGTFEETYNAEIAKTAQGYLESLIWLEAGTDNKEWKETFAYDNKGLLKTFKYYDWVDNEFFLYSIVTNVWYQNPVNGPTGGLSVYFESDAAGNPVGEYETVDWTEKLKTRHYFSAPEEEDLRISESLEKIRL